MRIDDLKSDAKMGDIIAKLNEVIAKVNTIQPNVVCGPNPRAYDLGTALRKIKIKTKKGPFKPQQIRKVNGR